MTHNDCLQLVVKSCRYPYNDTKLYTKLCVHWFDLVDIILCIKCTL